MPKFEIKEIIPATVTNIYYIEADNEREAIEEILMGCNNHVPKQTISYNYEESEFIVDSRLSTLRDPEDQYREEKWNNKFID